MIKDSGARRQFYGKDGEELAVRDIQEGKGRCDLMPLGVIAKVMNDSDPTVGAILTDIYRFQVSNDVNFLYQALQLCSGFFENNGDMFLELSKHFEEGAKKYGENNWQKGLPTSCYLDSAVRHLLKHYSDWNDERHDRATVWNIICCIWTCEHKPELNDYAKKDVNDEKAVQR